MKTIVDVEKSIKSFLRRSKMYSYSTALLVTFLITGHMAYTQEEIIITEEIVETVPSRQQLDSEIDEQKAKIDELIRKNESSINRIDIQAAQLLEQGEQVIKPWDRSWQIGINYFWSNIRKHGSMDKYPYPEIYSRNDNIFFKTISPTSHNYEFAKEKLEREIRANPNMFLGSSISKIFSNYDFLDLFAIPEHPYEVELTVDITPKTVNREAVNIDMGEVKLNIPTPANLPSDAVEPIKPTVEIASFSPVAPSVVIPELPTPPTLVFLAYPDCNFCERLLSSNADTVFGTEYRKNFYRLHNTWYDDSSYPKEGLMFKTNYISSSGTTIDSFNKTNVEDRDNVIKVDSYNPPKHYYTQKGLTAPKYTQENMPNSASKISDATELAKARNRQSFLVGGGRAIEFDSDGGYLLPGITIEMGGPLVFGIAKQDGSYNAFNYGTITDKTEKDDDYLKYLTFDDDGYLVNTYFAQIDGVMNALIIDGKSTLLGPILPTSTAGANAKYAEYRVRKSKDGYLGLKIGMAQIEEDSMNDTLANRGEVDLRGEKSIGLYIYGPYKKKTNSSKIINDRGVFTSDNFYHGAKGIPESATEGNPYVGKLLISGENSYAMKWSAQTDSVGNEVSFVNRGEIELRKNPDGDDRADSAVGMAVTVDDSFSSNLHVTIPKGLALNDEEGIIRLKDNIANSIGQYVNIASNLTNKGLIEITAKPEDGLNMGMYAKQVEKKDVGNLYGSETTFNTEIINSGKINLFGNNIFGMIAEGKTMDGENIFGRATARNKGTITTENPDNDTQKIFGMLAKSEAEIINEKEGTIKVTGSKNNVGMVITRDKQTPTLISLGTNAGKIEATGHKTTAVYNEGKFTMSEKDALIKAAGVQGIGLYAKGQSGVDYDNSPEKTIVEGGTIEATNFAVGLYPDDTTIELNNKNNLKLIAGENGLLFYNYSSESGDTPSGKILLNSDINANIKNKGTAFYLKNAAITNDGNVTGIGSFLNDLVLQKTNEKLKLDIEDGGTIVILDKPTGAAITLSSLATTQNIQSSLGNKVEIATPNNKYRVYSVYRGKLKIDMDSNIDDISDPIHKVTFSSSDIIIDTNKTVKAANPGTIAFYQANYSDGTVSGTVDEITINNKGKIELSGDSITGANPATTTAIIGNFVTINNEGEINILGKNGMAIYGSNGSITKNSATGKINLSTGSIGIYANNRIAMSDLGTKNIDVTNDGQIISGDNTEKIFGIYAKHDPAEFSSATAGIKTGANSLIDLAKSKKSVGILGENTNIDNKGSIKVAKDSTAIKVVDGDLNDTGKIELNGGATAYNISSAAGHFTHALNLNSNVKLKGKDNAILYFKGIELNNITENINVDSNEADNFIYMSLDDAKLNYSTDKILNGKGITFVGAKNSEVVINSDITLNGENAVLIFAEGEKAGATNEITTGAGKNITINGKNGTGIFAKNARVLNQSNMDISENGLGIYTENSNSTNNSGNISLAADSTGIFVKNPKNFVNSGNITTKAGADSVKGIVVSNDAGLPNITWHNQGNIDLVGQLSVGIYTYGDGQQQVINDGVITIADSNPGADIKNVGIYAKNSNIKLTNTKDINVGKNSLGIVGHDITTENTSNINVNSSGIGIYSDSSNLDIKGKMNLEAGADDEETIGVYYNGENSNIDIDLSQLTMKDYSIGVVISNENGTNTLNSTLPTLDLNNDSIYIYSKDTKATITSNTKITGNGNKNYAYYIAGKFDNHRDIDFSNDIGSIGIYSSAKSLPIGPAVNHAKILVGKSSIGDNLYSIGMAAGFADHDSPSNSAYGNIVNKGEIIVNNPDSIGMYAIGRGSKAINDGNITINAANGIGIFLGEGAEGENTVNGIITINPDAIDAKGVYVSNDAIFKNYGTIKITAPSAKGIYLTDGGTVVEDSNTKSPTIVGAPKDAAKVYKFKPLEGGVKQSGPVQFRVFEAAQNKDTEVKINGDVVVPQDFDLNNDCIAYDVDGKEIDYSVIEKLYPTYKNNGFMGDIGMYIDTSGINFTNPIEGLDKIAVSNADLIIGTEAAMLTNAKVIKVGKNILEKYNEAIKENPQIEKWNLISGSLTWLAVPNRIKNSNKFESIIMAKIPYTDLIAKDDSKFNFADGLEQRYNQNAIDSREKQVFNKLNSIGANEILLYKQAMNEMLGNQYSNTLRRINASRTTFAREFDDLMHWQTETKDTMKVKAFGETNRYISKKAGVISYDRNAQGVFILNNNETVRLGQSHGLFAGIANEQFKFKDIGGSKEKAITGEIGYYKSNAYGYNNEVNWTWKAGIEGSYRRMNRRYLVVDDIFHAKSKYHSYGVFLDNTVGRNYRVSENLTLEPYAGLDLAAGKVGKIHENTGEIRLDIKSKDYYSVIPNAGVKAKYNIPLGTSKIVTSMDVNLSKELGNMDDGDMKARVNRTEAGYYSLVKDKKDNATVGVVGRIGVENESYGVALKAGYSSANKAINGGLEFRVKF